MIKYGTPVFVITFLEVGCSPEEECFHQWIWENRGRFRCNTFSPNELVLGIIPYYALLEGLGRAVLAWLFKNRRIASTYVLIGHYDPNQIPPDAKWPEV